MSSILLVDDDQSLSELLTTYLESEGFQIHQAFNGEEALTLLEKETVELMVLDIMMPVKDGFETLRALRQSSNKQVAQLPVIMLTAKGEDIDRIVGLEMGADDYLGKPCNPRELVARIRAVLRRHNFTQPDSSATDDNQQILTVGNLNLDTSKFEAKHKDTTLPLTGAEFKLLYVFLTEAGKVLNKAYLSEQVLNRPLEPYDRSMDVHISNLRKKLTKVGVSHDVITNIRSQGYLFNQQALN